MTRVQSESSSRLVGAISRVRATASGHAHLLRSALSILIAMIIQALGGFAVWLTAARTTDATSVGQAAALMSSAYFVMYLTNFGLVAMVSRFAVRRNAQDRLRYVLAALITIGTTMIGAAIYWSLVLRDRPSADAIGGLTLFVLASGALSSVQILDVRLAAMKRRGLLIGRVSSAAVMKLLLLVLLAPMGSVGVFLAVVIPDATFGVVAAVFALVASLRDRRTGVRLTDRQRLTQFAGFAYVSALAMNAPIVVLPVIVLVNVPADTYGSFFVAWGIMGAIFLVPQAAYYSMLIEGGRGGADVGAQFRLAVRLVGAISVLAFAASFFVALLVPVIYGQDFSETSALLPWFMAGAVPWCVVVLCMSDARARERPYLSVAIGVAASVACLPLALALTRSHGVAGTAVAWVAGTAVAGVVSLVLRSRDLAARASTLAP